MMNKDVLLEEPLEGNDFLNKESEVWDINITSRASWFDLNLKEIWKYRDLLQMFVKRDIVTVYKQTILGPIWFIIQPVLTSLTYLVIFGKLAGISTDGVPPILFYLAGTTLWNFFADSFNNTSKTFKENEDIFGKVYFPRLIMPLAKVASGLIKFVIQMGLFLLVYFYYLYTDAGIAPNYTVLLIPVYLILMAGIGLGFGIIFSSLTNKYRDLIFLIQFGVQLLMYATPVIYPVSSLPEKYQFYMQLNPITSILEGFKFALLGSGSFSPLFLTYSCAFTIVLLLFGIVIFNKTEKTFMDTV
jgi:lipopolysaccharide transport system permease protein